jgi:hypothetical protein
MPIIAMTRLLLASVMLVLAYGCAKQSSDNDPRSNAHSSTAGGNESKSDPAVHAYIDPKTGALREPTTEELAAEAAAEAQRKQAAAANPQSEQNKSREVVTPSGAVEIQLDKSNEQPLRACIDGKGNLKMEHECEAQGDKR